MDIRRIASPLTPFRQDYNDNCEENEKIKKEEIETDLKKPEEILKGTISGINERICNLQSNLYEENCSLTIDNIKQKNTENYNCQDADNFGAKYETFLKINQVKAPVMRKKKTVFNKPQLVELQQYPGFEVDVFTPLPHSVKVSTINCKVICTLTHLHNKPTYKKFLTEQLNTDFHQNLLLDFFWWYFLEKFGSNEAIQGKLFSRIALSFGALYTLPAPKKYWNLFFQEYSDILSRCIYCAFSHCFPQSNKQFDSNTFISAIYVVTSSWIDGIRPYPRPNQSWDMKALQPVKQVKEETVSIETSEKSMKSSTGSANKKSSTRLGSKSKKKTLTTEKPYNSKKKRKPSRYSKQVSDKQVSDKQSSALDPKEMKYSSCKFNIEGRTPLLVEYFRQIGIHQMIRPGMLVTRTQVCSLPRKGCKTLEDVIEDSNKYVTATIQKLDSIIKAGKRAEKELHLTNTEDDLIINKKACQLIKREEKVSLLSNLVLAELKKDPKSTPQDAQHAIWLAVINEKI